MQVKFFPTRPGVPVARVLRSQVPQAFRRRVPMRRVNFRGLGDYGDGSQIPLPSGAPGNLLWPYDERDVWGANLPPGGGLPAVISPPQIGAPAAPAPTTGDGFAPSSPFGESDRKWSNPTTFASVPVNASTNTNAPVLSLNLQRNALIIQNNSTATSPDVAPTFYIGFNAQPQVLYALALAPGLGIAWDIITPRDSIYILFGGGSGPTQVIAGAVVQGTYAPLS